MIDTTVCVVGGGPAGAVVAGCLAADGVDTVLVDAPTAPTRIVPPVQSIAAPALRLLADLGAADPATWTTRTTTSACIRWDDPTANPEPYEQVLVDRSTLDPGLRAWALGRGARYLMGRAIGRTGPDSTGPAVAHGPVGSGPGHVVEVATADRTVEIRTTALVLATGRAATLGMTRRACGPRTLALAARLTGSMPADMCVEAVPDGWLWAAADLVHDGTGHLLAVCDPVPRRRARTTVAALLSSSTILADAVVLDGAVVPADATASMLASTPPARMHVVGDAALATDPLSGQGVALAIRSAVQVADALARDGAGAATAEVTRAGADVADHHRRATAEHLDRAAHRFESTFWRARRSS